MGNGTSCLDCSSSGSKKKRRNASNKTNESNVDPMQKLLTKKLKEMDSSSGSKSKNRKRSQSPRRQRTEEQAAKSNEKCSCKGRLCVCSAIENISYLDRIQKRAAAKEKSKNEENL